MLKLVNEARREAGVSEVGYASEMPNAQNAANARAEELSVKYNHTRPSGVIQDLQRECGVSINFSRENIAHVGFNYMDVDGVLYTPNKPETEALYFFNLWTSDHDHKANILMKTMNEMVCSIYVGKGEIYAVQWFANNANHNF